MSFEQFLTTQEFTFDTPDQRESFELELEDWGQYKYLVFYLQGSSDLDIAVEFRDEKDEVIFRDSLINYVVTTPQPGKWVKVMVPALPKVVYKEIIFANVHEFIPGEGYVNTVKVRNMYLHSSPEEDLFCSGAIYRGGYVVDIWINDIDANIPDQRDVPVGKRACDANNALNWTGSMCCGDDNSPEGNEYYVDPSGGFCWNGLALPEDTPAMDVEFEVDYTVTDYELAEQNYSFSMDWTERKEEFIPMYGKKVHRKHCSSSHSGRCTTGLKGRITLTCPEGYDVANPVALHVDTSLEKITARSSETNSSATFECHFGSVGSGSTRRCTIEGEIDCYKTWPEEKSYTSQNRRILPEPGENNLGMLSDFFVGHVTPYLWDDPYRGNESTIVSPYSHGVVSQVHINQSENENVWVRFNNSLRNDTTDFSEIVVAKIIHHITKPVPRSVHKNLTYFCAQGECDFLSPQPSFNVSNPRSDVYDLSFVRNGSTPISYQPKLFSHAGIISATNTNQQIVVSEGEVGLCDPEDYIVEKIGEASIFPLCQIFGSHFCSGLGWSNEASGGLTPVERDTQKSVFSGRNMLRNPSFDESDGGVPLFWSLTQGTDTDQVRVFSTADIQTNTVRLFDDLALEEVGIKSDPVRVSSDTIYTLSADVLCNNTGNSLSLAAQLYDGDSLISEPSSVSSSVHLWERIALEFDSSTASHVVAMIKMGSNTGECFVDNVMLQEGKDNNPLYHDYVAGVVSQSCCNTDYCWEGTQCTPDVSASPLSEPIHENRCIQGDWVVTPRVAGVDGVGEGFCPSASECLVDVDGTIGNTPADWYTGNTPLCIDDSEFFEDNLCDNGMWTSRTRLLSLAMLELVNKTGDTQDYTLYCDNFDKALVDVEYSNIENTILGSLSLGPLVEKSCFDESLTPIPCVNNFCVLQFTDKFDGEERRVVATSLNKPIDDSRDSFLSAFDRPVNFCDDAQDQAGFAKCSNDDKIWYSSELNALITSQKSINLEGPSGNEQFFYVMRNPIQSLIGWIVGAQQGALQRNVEFAERTNRFDRLFIDVDEEKRINGVIEKVGTDEFVLVSYENYDIDVCSYVNAAARTQGIGSGAQISDITCEKEGDVYNVFTDSRTDLWQQFILPGRGDVQVQTGPLN